MARLILDENGKRRAFKLNNGKLTLGSGEGCALRLQSDNVAEVHAELEIADGVVTLIPKPGVQAPVLLGRPVKGPTRLAANAEFHIGAALLRIESDEAAPVAAKKTPGRSAARKAPGRSTAPVRSPRAGTPASNGGRREGTVTSQRRQVQKGIPSWAILGILAVVLGFGYMFSGGWMGEGKAEDWAGDPGERYRQALVDYNEGATKGALTQLSRINLDEVGPDLKKKIQALHSKLTSTDEASEIATHNVKGTAWFESNIKKYEGMYLSGDKATRARARLFVKRCDDFKKEYPQHPQLGWINRFRTRHSRLADMGSADQLADVQWEVKRLTAAKPRDYALVFRLLDRFIANSGGEDATVAGGLRAVQVTERQEYFIDRLLESQHQWKKGNYGAAVEWLVQVILKIGDADMEEQAVDSFLKMTNKEGAPMTHLYLASYQKDRPRDFAILMENPRLRSAAKAAGVL